MESYQAKPSEFSATWSGAPPLNSLIPSNTAAPLSRLLTLIAVCAVLVGLFFGRPVLIPLALAMVFAFVLAPLVGWLEKSRMGRVPVVVAVLLLVFALLGSLGWIVTGQLAGIVDQLPSYQSNIRDKIRSLRLPHSSRLRTASNTVSAIGKEISAASAPEAEPTTGKSGGSRSIPIQVTPPPTEGPQFIKTVIGPLAGVVETSAMVTIFALFMLLKREDLRNRLIRLVGTGHLHSVTQALDDASTRLSRYLLFLFLVNMGYGILCGLIAYAIGIPHALLWGVLSGSLRFVPYIGTPIAAVFPLFMAIAVFPGWSQAVLVFGLFVVLELVIANVVEPWLYGAHTGISSFAIVVSAVFWAILWGPVGLILSTPLTVCLLLLGRYVPQLKFLEVLLGDEPVLPVEAHFYQRLLALDQEEAREVAEAYLKERRVDEFYDSVLIPALVLAERDRHTSALDEEKANFIFQSARELIEELGERAPEESASSDEPALSDARPEALAGMRIFCIPAMDDADELVAMMLGQLLTRLGCDVRQLPIEGQATMSAEITEGPSCAVVISALPPFAFGPTCALCRRVAQGSPNLNLIVGLWSLEENVAKAAERLGLRGTNRVATSLQDAVSLLGQPKGSGNQTPPSGMVEQEVGAANP